MSLFEGVILGGILHYFGGQIAPEPKAETSPFGSFETPMSSPPEEEELYSTTDQQDKQGSEVNPHRPQKKFVELLLLQSTFRVLQWRIRRRIDFIDAVQSIVSELNTKKIESNQNCPKENDTGIDTGIDNLAYLLTSREFGPFT